jgi:prephenate dehydratase
VAVLKILAEHKFNLTKILSRPIIGRFEEYRFMIEFLGAPPTKEVVETLEQIKKITTFFAVIGTYPVKRI